jgi:hypothetical protein
VLSKVFRGKFTDGLKHLFQQKKLGFHGALESLQEPRSFARFLRTLYQNEWVVYAKKPFGGPEHVLHYLARYTHRVAISKPPDRHGGRQGQFPLAGLRPRPQTTQDDTGGRGVHPPLPDARTAQGLRADTPLRLDGQPRPARAGGAMPSAAGCGTRPTADVSGGQRRAETLSHLRRGSRGSRDDHPSRVVTSEAQPET